jgi:hypothetical protein
MSSDVGDVATWPGRATSDKPEGTWFKDFPAARDKRATTTH